MEIELNQLNLDVGASIGVDEIRAYGPYTPFDQGDDKIPICLKEPSQRLAREFQNRHSGLEPNPPLLLRDELKRLGSLEDNCVHGHGSQRTSGRGLLCSCYNGNYINVTVRKDKKKMGVSSFPKSPAVGSAKKYKQAALDMQKAGGARTCEFIPDTSTDSFHFSIAESVNALFNCIYPDPKSSITEPGLILVAGGTGSGKSQIVRGLIYNYLLKVLEDRSEGKKQPHFLTVENPIEKYLFVDAVTKIRSDPTTIQEEFRLDYTPRQMPGDTPSLEQALMQDALRQTPNLVFVGELRKPQEFKTALDFAETGHSIISTMHAASLPEAMQRVLAACEADTPAKRGQIAQRIIAIVHMEPFSGRFPSTGSTQKEASIPCLWRRNNSGWENLVATGLSSIVLSGADKSGNAQKEQYCTGRAGFLSLLNQAKEQTGAPLDSYLLNELLNECIKSDMKLR